MEEEEGRVAAVYEQHARRMWRALFSFTGDPEIASDAMAEAFARALADDHAIRDVASWTWRVAFRLASEELKRRRSGVSADPLMGEHPTYEMPEPVPEVMDALNQLSPNQRVAVILHDYADRPTREIADVIGCSPATVHVHLSQGRRRLRTILEER